MSNGWFDALVGFRSSGDSLGLGGGGGGGIGLSDCCGLCNIAMK